ncbi:MAG: bifunctional hydroxymethylpyrimidine kinase/phosphomethylpyrimidine kinase [Vicinamibacterales bacterium]
MRRVLTIAGSDSGAGAGIQADLKTFAAHHVYGTTAITAVTAQNTLGVTQVLAMPSDLVTAQIEAIVGDIGVDAAKTGMLPNAAVVEAVAAAVEALEIPLLVVDPVMVAKSGDRLIDDEALGALRAELLRHAFVVTPNIPEAEVLAGFPITTDDDRRRAAEIIHRLGSTAVIIKGGHFGSGVIRDLLFDHDGFSEFEAERVQSRNTHGTGCTFSAALAAHLAMGRTLREAVPLVQKYIATAIRKSPSIGHGHGPMQHFV